MRGELKHLGWEEILAAKGNAWALEILVYIVFVYTSLLDSRIVIKFSKLKLK